MVKEIRWLTNRRDEFVTMAFELDEAVHAVKTS